MFAAGITRSAILGLVAGLGGPSDVHVTPAESTTAPAPLVDVTRALVRWREPTKRQMPAAAMMAATPTPPMMITRLVPSLPLPVSADGSPLSLRTLGGEGEVGVEVAGDDVELGAVLVGASWMALTATERAGVVRKVEALDGVASCVVRAVMAAAAILALDTAIEKERSTEELWRARARRRVAVTVSVTAADVTLSSVATLKMMAARTEGV